MRTTLSLLLITPNITSSHEQFACAIPCITSSSLCQAIGASHRTFAVNKQAANQQAGETGEDFFRTMDRDGSGSIDQEEAKAFFSSLASASSMMGSRENAAKDEV